MTKILFGLIICVTAPAWSSLFWGTPDADLWSQSVFSSQGRVDHQGQVPEGSRLRLYLPQLRTSQEVKEGPLVQAQAKPVEHGSRQQSFQKENYGQTYTVASMDDTQEWSVTKAQCLFAGYANLGNIYVRRNLKTLAVDAYKTALQEGGHHVPSEDRKRVQASLAMLLSVTRARS